MAGTEPQALKRKKPPTFRHLPTNRAKKLKETWVANAKIKSQWKAQKRKEAGLQVNTQAEDTFEGIKSDNEQSQPEDESDRDASPAKSPSPPPPVSKTKPRPQEKKHLSKDKPKAVPPHDRKRQRRTQEKSDEEEPQPSLREITREAYSKNSLHTFKAGHGRGGHQSGRTARGQGRGGGGGGRGGKPTGRGQPDMKLRMNAMLERIKQTMS